MSTKPDETPAARRPTMREVAALAGVSLATVSRVLNGTGQVRPDLAERVHDAVALLSYRRDLTATNLRRGDRVSGTIGLILDDVSNPFDGAVHRGVEVVVRARGLMAFAASSEEDPDRERELTQALLSRRVDGLVVMPSGGALSYLAPERDAGVALVFVDRPPPFLDGDYVVSDNAGGARAGTVHLIRAGHRRIGYLGDRLRIHTAAERLRGYRQALAEAGIAYDPALVRTELADTAAARHAALELLRGAEAPTALFAARNVAAVGSIQALRAAGRMGTAALVGFDDIPLADAVEPGVTVVAQDVAGLGRTAAELLFARLDGDRGPSRQVVLPTTLIERGSGELPPVP